MSPNIQQLKRQMIESLRNECFNMGDIMSVLNHKADIAFRDEAAIAIMQALVSNADGVQFGISYKENNHSYAMAAYSMADAMIQARTDTLAIQAEG